MKYGVVFYENTRAALSDLEAIKQKRGEVDQLNIVLKDESQDEDPTLADIGTIYAGSAWALVHERRVAEGWYEKEYNT